MKVWQRTVNGITTTSPSLHQKDVVSWEKETGHDKAEASFLVKDIDYENGELIVTYQDGFRAKYDGITPEQVADFVKAPSKGRWAHQHLWKLPYQAV